MLALLPFEYSLTYLELIAGKVIDLPAEVSAYSAPVPIPNPEVLFVSLLNTVVTPLLKSAVLDTFTITSW